MNQENTLSAPEEQFKGQQPFETTISNIESENFGTIALGPSDESVETIAEDNAEKIIEEKAEKKLEEVVEPEEGTKDISLFQQYAALSLPEILLEFNRLLNLKDSTSLMRNAELLKSLFYKGLLKERKGDAFQEVVISEPPVLEDGDDVGFMEMIREEAIDELIENEPDETLLFSEEENAFKNMYSKYKMLRADFLKQMELQKEHNLQLKYAIIDELKKIVEKQEDLNYTFPEFRILQNRWKEVGPVPVANTKDIWDTYQHYVEKFYDYVKINNELRDLDFRKNLESKTILCEKAEELLLDSNALSSFHKLQKLHEEWRESGPVAREHREVVWERFKAATSEINRRHQTYFESQKEVQKKNLDKKIALCINAEQISKMEHKEASDWNKSSKEVENLQKEWRTIGFASKKDNQKVYDRFRAACNSFYEGKRNYYVRFKQEMHENYLLKVELCKKAEALMESVEWRRTSELLVNLQRQWKEIGPVTRKHSDQIWKRFRSACDAFFENKSKHFVSIDDNYDKNLISKEALIEEISRYEPSRNNEENVNVYKEFMRRWAEIGFVPIKEKERIHSAYLKKINDKFGSLRLSSDTGRKTGRSIKRTEDIHLGNKPERSFRSEREKLLFKFRQMETDIALWENNMGFFAKSKNAANMIAEMEHKISLAKQELLLIEKKIKTLDQQFE